jgi:hypothetical protein
MDLRALRISIVSLSVIGAAACSVATANPSSRTDNSTESNANGGNNGNGSNGGTSNNNGSGNGGNGGNSGSGGMQGGGSSDAGSAMAFSYRDVFEAVDQSKLQKLLGDMSGQNPVTVNGSTFTIQDRYLPASKTNYRKYWSDYMTSLGLTPTTLTYTTKSGQETSGHNVEAVLPGKVADSVVSLVHYDSIGPNGADNAGADDDMTGMSILMETARILTSYKGRLRYTVRFVATDYEEWSGLSLEGARKYATYLEGLSKNQGFKIIAAIDNEQSGWKHGEATFDVVDHKCGATADPSVLALSKLMTDTATTYSTLSTTNLCNDGTLASDYEAMGDVGVPAFVFSEHAPSQNNHFDQNGGDTYAKIDQAYFFGISQVAVTFAARVVGIDE